ncbi:MAG: DinB family protein [Pseudomonadota bacterium]
MTNHALMARFNAWANDKLYDSVARLSDADYRADRKLFFGSAHNTLNHLLVVDRMWTRRIEGKPHGIRALDEILHDEFGKLRAARAEEDAYLIALVDRLDAAALATPVRFSWVDGDGEGAVTPEHILINLFNHQTHHRGQIHALLTQSDINSPPLDVLVYLEDDRAT